jgi:hypothetical protein
LIAGHPDGPLKNSRIDLTRPIEGGLIPLRVGVNVLSANRLKGAADDRFAIRTRHTGYREMMLLIAIHEVFLSPWLLAMFVPMPNKRHYPTGREFFNP